MEELQNAEYRKEGDGKSYLLLPRRRDAFEEQMIRNALPSGVLVMQKSEREEYYKYEITGKKSLTLTFERVPMNAEQVRKVLLGIIDVLQKAEEYLLSEEHFILKPEYIFLTIPEYEVSLCFYPEYRALFGKKMGELFEMLLNRVDYREEEAIALVYALYMQIQEPDMTMERLKEKLKEQDGIGHRGNVAAVEQRRGNKEAYVQKEREMSLRNKEREESEKKKKTFFWDRRKREVEKKSEPVPACVMEEAPEWGMQHTRVISVRKDASCPTLVSESGDNTIEITKFPFYIGSYPGYVDGVIQRDTVSRFHAKLLQKDGEVLLADLNSTNGTKINGKTVNVQESVRVSSGDCISFAEEDFYYFEVK